jgi:hypothetical protein
MTRNPLINALAAALYIIAVASFMYYGPRLAGPVDSVIIPIAMLSLFVLSAAVMGTLFFYQPVLLCLDGKKQEATTLFLKTLGTFALITLLIFVTLFFISRVSV